MRHVKTGGGGADVHEIRRPAVGCPHHVERRETEPRAIDHKPDIAIERDVVEVAVLRRGLDRVALGRFAQRHQFGVPEQGIVVDGDLGIHRHETARFDPQQEG